MAIAPERQRGSCVRSSWFPVRGPFSVSGGRSETLDTTGPLRREATAVDKDQAARYQAGKRTAAAKQDKPASPAVGKGIAPNPRSTGGPKGLEPTRYGDWERKGIAVDF